MEQGILFTVSGVFCIAMPARVLELFQEMLQGGSDMSLRAEGMRYRSTDKEKTKETGLFLKAICASLYCGNVSPAFERWELSCLSASRRIIRPRTDAYQRCRERLSRPHAQTRLLYQMQPLDLSQFTCCSSSAPRQM